MSGSASDQVTRLLRRQLVEQVTGLPTSSLYAAMKAGQFPKPVNISPRRVAWREADVNAWIASRTAAGGGYRG